MTAEELKTIATPEYDERQVCHKEEYMIGL